MPADEWEGGVDQKKRVAAYFRISTELEDQYKSLEAQVNYYKNLNLNNPNWKLEGIFFDCESVMRKSKRSGLEGLMTIVRAEQVDCILTKSLSRVSRNVLDILLIVRELKERGVGIYQIGTKLIYSMKTVVIC